MNCLALLSLKIDTARERIHCVSEITAHFIYEIYPCEDAPLTTVKIGFSVAYSYHIVNRLHEACAMILSICPKILTGGAAPSFPITDANESRILYHRAKLPLSAFEL